MEECWDSAAFVREAMTKRWTEIRPTKWIGYQAMPSA